MQGTKTNKCPACGLAFKLTGDKLEWTTALANNEDHRKCKSSEGIVWCAERNRISELAQLLND